MNITLHSLLILCPLVFLAGLVDSIAGGGGLISLPAYYLTGIPVHNAIATNKLSSSLGTFIATLRYSRHKQIDWGLGIPSVAAALVGSALGANLVLYTNEGFLKNLLLIILPIAAFFVLKGKKPKEEEALPSLPRKKLCVIVIFASFLIGAYDGFYGPGTGTFLILAYHGIAKMDIRLAAGNTKLINLASNISAMVIFLLHGKIYLLTGLLAACFSIAGNYLGAGLVIKNGHKIIRPLILVVLLLLFLKIIGG